MLKLEQVTFPSRAHEVGSLRGVLHLPDETPIAGVVICHPYPPTSNMDRPVEVAVAQTLCARGVAALRFNFHSVGQAEVDLQRGPSELLDVGGAIDYFDAMNVMAGGPLYLCGRSFGASMALHWGVNDKRVAGIVAISTPLDWADEQVIPREALMHYARPKLLIVGDRDHLCSVASLRRLMEALPEPKESYVLPNADHYLSARPEEVAEVAADALVRWAKNRPPRAAG